MKIRIFYLQILAVLLFANVGKTQQNVGIGTSVPDPSAILHLNATDKGLLIPNITEAERLVLPNPANGLMVYQRDGVSGIYINKSFNPLLPNWVHITEGINLWTQHPVNTDHFYSISTANIGINNSSPLQKLSVGGGVTVDAGGVNNGSTDNSLKFGGDNASAMIQSNKLGAINTNGLDLLTGGLRRLSILNSGNIGINLTNPLSRLGINGNVAIGSTYPGSNAAPANGLLVQGNTSLGTTGSQNRLDVNGSVAVGLNYAGIYAAPTNGFIVEGNVGVGTNEPISKLTMVTPFAQYGLIHTDPAGSVQFGSYISSSAGWLGTKTNHPLYFFTNNSGAQMTLGSNGNLGMGTTTPHNAALVDLTATNKGLLLPRLNNTQMGGLASIAPDGMLIYNTDQTGLFLKRSGSFVKLIDIAATMTLPYSSLVNSSSNLFTVQNSGTGGAIWATTNSNSSAGIHAENNGSHRALEAISNTGDAAYFSTSGNNYTAIEVGLGRTGLGTSTPQNRLDVEGGVAIGSNYAGNNTSPADGLIVQGIVGIGTSSPDAQYSLDVNGRMRLRHNAVSSGLWFNKSDNNLASFLGMVNDTTLGIWGTTGAGYFKNSFNQRNGNFGINVSNPLKPLSFDNNIGNKIALYGSDASLHYGLGIGNNTMRMYVPTLTERFEFGLGNASSFTEVARLTGAGQWLLGVQSSIFNTELASFNANGVVISNRNAHTVNTLNKITMKTAGVFDASIRTTATGLLTSRLGFFTGASVTETNLLERMSITQNGDVLIGTTNETPGAGYKLRVAGKIISEELKVQLQANWPDYVFEENYPLTPLEEVEKYIKANHHLPNFPPANEIEQAGLEVGEMQRKMMEKIEELTLYIIELKKENALIKKEILDLKSK